MASPSADRDASVRDDSERPNQPEPAFQEAQKWIEAVTGKRFGDKDFRSGLENGILLCELLSAIKPGLVKKINRLPTPIAGLDNLSVFLRGCEELGLKGAQLFDPGDLQDTSIRANLKDSDCNRKLKNVLNTVFWLGKAASGCASYSGPSLNLKEFEGLLAQMRVESEDGGESPQKRSVRDSGYDCWDSERSESLSPPRHTRDNSLDSLDSFGSHSQHCPSPDVVNRGNGDGRGSDSEVDASRRPDVRKDDMLARRTANSDLRSPVPFNQFLPNRTNASSYIPNPRRKPNMEEGEQRSHAQTTPEQGKRPGPNQKSPKTVTWASENNGEKIELDNEKMAQEMLEQKRLQKLERAGIKVLPAAVRYSSPPSIEGEGVRSPSPNIILRCENDFLSSQKSAFDSPSDEEEEAEVQKVPDVQRDDLASRRAHRGPAPPKVHQFVPPPTCSDKDRERWEGIRQASQKTLQEKESSEKEVVGDILTRRDNPFLRPAPRNDEEEDEEEEGEEGKVKVMPNKHIDDLAQRRAQGRPRPLRDGPMSFVSATINQADMEKWERLKMTEPSEASPVPMCQACLEKNYGSPFSGSAKAGRGHSKVVTFGAVTEMKQPIDTATSSEGVETGVQRRLFSKTDVAMPTIRLGSQLSEREHSQVGEGDPNQSTTPPVDLPPWSPETPSTPSELDARLAQYEQRRQEEEEEEEEEDRVPDLQKDDMMARRTGVFHKQTSAMVTYNRFLPLPATKRCSQGEVTIDAAPRSKRQVQADKNRKLNVRVEHQQPRVPMESPPPHPDATVIRATWNSERGNDEDEDEYEENEPLPDLEKDDMMARRTGSHQKQSAVRTNQPVNQFLPVPGAIKYSIAPVSAMKPLHSRPKSAEKLADESSVVAVQAEPQSPLTKTTTLPKSQRLGKRQDLDGEGDEHMTALNPAVSNVNKPVSSPLFAPPPTPVDAQTSKSKAELEKKTVQGRVEEEVKERRKDVKDEPQKKPLWLDDDLPPMMMSRRVAFMSEETESVSMSDILNEEEVGYLPPLSQSRHERMHEQYNNFMEDEDHWQDDLARWKNRRRSASQELIKKEEERKKLEKRLKEEESDANKRKSIKTYKEIVEEKERREAELCIDYRNAATPEEAAMVLQRYALRFTISDATLDSLKLPRSTSAPKQDPNHVDELPESLKLINVTLEPLHKSEPALLADQTPTNPEEMETETTVHQDTSVSVSSSCPLPSSPFNLVTESETASLQSLQHNGCQFKPAESPTSHQELPQPKHTTPQIAQVQPHTTPPVHTPPSPAVTPRPVPLLVAKPYCQPRIAQPGQKPFKTDGLVRVNGEPMDDLPVSAPATSAQLSPKVMKDVPSKPAEKDIPTDQPSTHEEATEQPPSPQTEKPTPSSGSAISSLIGGRNCIITTTIVTELTQTIVEPHHPDVPSNGEVNGALGSSERLAASPSSMQEYSPTVTEGLEESSVTEQYQREQEKLKKEWEKAQLEVEEEERKHNEEERRILEETVMPLTPTGALNHHLGQTGTTIKAPESNTESGNTPLEKTGQSNPTENEDQHPSKLHFVQDSSCDREPSKKQELWKTASLDRNPQLNQTEIVKRSESHNTLMSKQQSFPSSPQPPSPSRCVSGKRLCSGCSQPLGKGAAMIIDTLGLYFHMQCFKCGVCKGQLGDATAGTDVRIRNGLLSCHECYIASRGRGQPTTL
ncbi:LIM and calponin homology domains-containing protein 1-like isoform X2 [Antennarius striatus]|uniref:LIM and calponin homology domains-containing protein 1-like isoform X2 n=1 Tax=Antennarius striatus TaxID=241820 RepID=UPI0035AF25AB